MAGCTASPTTPPLANGGELATYQMELDLLGVKHEASVDSHGRLKESVQVTSADGTIGLSIDSDTILLDKDGKPLQLIQVAIDQTLPLPPEGAYIAGAVYVLRPQGATFNPPLRLTLSYDPDDLPQGIKEDDLYIACYEGTEWDIVRYKQVDTERHKIATRIDHFARYAVLALKAHPTSDTSSIPADRVEIVYFHRAPRCSGCIYAETGIRYTVETYFKDELASGKVTFEVFNVADKENASIVKKYGAFSSSLFINTIRDGTDHIEEITDIWFFLGDDEAFVEVVRDKIEKSLKGVR